jgi:dTDP-4-dehydrorhamnose 3,5-epimerase
MHEIDLGFPEFQPDSPSPLGEIDGVMVEKVTEHVDHRGRVFEFFSGQTGVFEEPLVFGHCYTILPRTMKGWGAHLHKDDRYCLIAGEVQVVLFDSRKSSSTYGIVQEIKLSQDGNRKLKIPAGVWHLALNLTDQEVFVIDMPTQPYNYSEPDKIWLSWNTEKIPYTVPENLNF